MKTFIGLGMLVMASVTAFGQRDTALGTLDSVIVNTYQRNQVKGWLPDVYETFIYAGKKSDMLTPDASKGNMAQNMSRLQFAQVAGLNMWEMDGAGTQLNISSRGTDAHRDIEMNMRQNGYMTNSDAFGYPENHYTVPLQGVQQVQYVRGSAALQFGPQFGGMMNYVMKDGDTSKVLGIESEQTAGSYHFFNSFNAVGGTAGKLQYYGYYDNRSGDGWRENARFNYHAYYAGLTYHFTKQTSVAVQYSRMDYVQQIAGGLTDSLFRVNAKQSIRGRNFFEPEINLAAMILKSRLGENTEVNVTSHVIFGERNSVQYLPAAKASGYYGDTVNLTTNTYNPRQVDRDYYNGFTTEVRVKHGYELGSLRSVLSGGVRYFTQITKRRQKGVGTTASDFDLSLTKPYGIDLRFETKNYAAFAENIFQITKNFSVTPGVRYEVIDTKLTGVINNAVSAVRYDGHRDFPLFGAGLQYTLRGAGQLYGNVSQEYRPFLNANVTPADRLDSIDRDLKDVRGYDVDLGWRGNYKNVVSWDVNAFYVFYGNRIGLLPFTGADGVSHLLTTNIGDAVAKGVETYVEVSLLQLGKAQVEENDVRVFNALSYTHARYEGAAINKGGVRTSIDGNYVENTPEWIEKAGVTFQHKAASLRVQYSYVSRQYNDALNTEFSANGITGEIPAYHVWDATLNWQFLSKYRVSAGLNNFTDEHYFNRRITMYPGPGILPADGRTFYVSFGVKL